MSSSYPDYAYGEDIGWGAVDRDGHVGLFTTGGWGPLPVRLVDACRSRLNQYERFIQELPVTSDLSRHLSYPDMESWELASAKGIFGFDWSDVHRRTDEKTGLYELVTAPVTPLPVTLLSDPLKALVKLVSLPAVSFTNIRLIDIRGLVACAERE